MIKFACKPNIDLILTKEELQRYVKQIAARKKEGESWNEKMGEVECILTIKKETMYTRILLAEQDHLSEYREAGTTSSGREGDRSLHSTH